MVWFPVWPNMAETKPNQTPPTLPSTQSGDYLDFTQTAWTLLRVHSD